MTILIALAPGQKDDAAVRLGSMLARSSAQDVVVLAVVPAPWPPDPRQADREFLAYQEDLARKALRRARTCMDGVLNAEFLVRRAESVPAGLLEMVEQRQVSSVVVGSSSTGLLGRVMLSGVAERLLHGTELPVAVAPRGFHEGKATRVSRVSVAFGRADHDGELVGRAVAAARDLSASLRVVCFAVRPMAAFVGAIDESSERLVVGEWRKRLEDDIATTLASVASRAGTEPTTVATSVETVLGQGTSWSQALHDVAWERGDLLVVGTSTGPLSRFFLGSHAAKIVRNSPVPVLLLARG